MTTDPLNPHDLNGQEFAAWMAAWDALNNFAPAEERNPQ